MTELFERYTQAFDSFDASAIANLYTLPCATSDVDGKNVYVDRASLISKFSENCSSMKAMGYEYAEFNILSEVTMGDAAKAVNVAWRVNTSATNIESSVIEFRSLYICHQVESDWLIFSANVYEGPFNDPS